MSICALCLLRSVSLLIGLEEIEIEAGNSLVMYIAGKSEAWAGTWESSFAAGSLKKKIARIPFKLGYSQQGDASKQLWQRLVNWVVANDLPSEEFQRLWDLQVRDEGDPTLSQGLLDPCCSAVYGKVQSPAPSGR
jgi:hypothetical protein